MKYVAVIVASALIFSPALAEEIDVQSPYWNALTGEEQQEIVDLMRASKLINDGDTLSSSVPELAEGTEELEEFKLKLPKLPKLPIPGLREICRAACDAAAAVAAGSCGGSAVAVAACLAAVAVGREECRRRC